MFIINKIVRQRRLAESLDREDSKTAPMSEKRLRRNQSVDHGHTSRGELDVKLTMQLSALQKRALRLTWRRLNSCEQGSAIRLMEEVFEKVAQKSPAANEIFYKVAFMRGLLPGMSANKNSATIRSHAKMMVDMIDSIIYNMEMEETSAGSSSETEKPDSIGCRHSVLVQYGFNGQIWETFGEVFADLMFRQDVVQAYPQGKKAWAILIAGLTDSVRVGFEKQQAKDGRGRTRSMHHKKHPTSSLHPGFDTLQASNSVP